MIMNRVLLLVLMSLFAMASMAQTKDYVEVMYFHGKQRCATCKAIEGESRTPVHNSSSRGVFRLSRFSGWGLVGKATNGANPCWSKLVPRHASCVRGGNPLR